MDYSALCSFSMSLTLPSSCSFHSNMVVFKGVERSRERRYNGDWWFTAMLRGVKTDLVKTVYRPSLGAGDLAGTQQLGLLKDMHLTTLKNKSRNQNQHLDMAGSRAGLK